MLLAAACLAACNGEVLPRLAEGSPIVSPEAGDSLIPSVDRTAPGADATTTLLAPTAAPTLTPSPTPTPTPTPTSTPAPHPLTIAWLRSQVFPGSEVTIEETLAPGANYHRYLASYRSEGLTIYALLTVPYGERPPSGWPVVIFNHGYIPPEQYRTTERYVAYVDGFAQHGYIVFRSDYRGHGSSEGVARGGYGSPDYTVDVLNAVAALRAFPDADPDRIGMWGHSMGGYITLRAMVAEQEIKAGVIWAGVVASYQDLLARWRRPASGLSPSPTPRPRSWRSGLVEIFGSPADNPAFWDSISANSYLAELSGPVQLHHGTADASVPFEFSEALYDQIQSAGGVAEFYAYPGDDHNISTSFSLAMQRSIIFFDQYLKGEG
jgi:dipeptidyl aminopeptidase/acylaminoacyl peptidase